MPIPDHVPPGWAAEVEVRDAMDCATQGVQQAACFADDPAVRDAAKTVYYRHQDLREVIDQCLAAPHHDTVDGDEIADNARAAVQRTYAALNAMWLAIGRTAAGEL
ncbi:hypothetical protein FRAHR75_770031 [Frankia sp. Hr75.2]|nr:hypothetical protein FRAHR75_770031 [Frankia sp. Hr75.2]